MTKDQKEAAAPLPAARKKGGASERRIVVDIGQAVKMLEASPELGTKLNEMVFGKVAADAIQQLTDDCRELLDACKQAAPTDFCSHGPMISIRADAYLRLRALIKKFTAEPEGPTPSQPLTHN